MHTVLVMYILYFNRQASLTTTTASTTSQDVLRILGDRGQLVSEEVPLLALPGLLEQLHHLALRVLRRVYFMTKAYAILICQLPCIIYRQSLIRLCVTIICICYRNIPVFTRISMPSLSIACTRTLSTFSCKPKKCLHNNNNSPCFSILTLDNTLGTSAASTSARAC